MSLQVWLPLNGNLNNQGLNPLSIVQVQSGVNLDNNGKIGKCYTNTGTNNSVITNCNFSATKFSMCAWIKINESTGGWHCPVKFNDANFTFGLGCEHTNGTSLGFHCYKYINGTGTSVFDTYAASVEIGVWVHYAIVYDGLKYYIYKNGSLLSSGNANLTNIEFNCTRLFLFGGSTSYTSKSSINDVRVYDHALSAKEVEEIAKGLVLHYKMDTSTNGILSPNLLLNSAPHLNALTSWSSAGTGWTNSLVEDSTAPYGHVVRCTYSGTTQTAGGTHHPTSVDKTTLTTGDIYTLSGWIRASKNCICNFYNELMTTTKQVNVTTQWQYFTHTSAIDTGKTYQSNVFYCRASDAEQNMWVEVKMLKLEKGSIATSWCPHTADTIYNAYYSNTVYDSSGYQHNGDLTNNEIASDTARYTSALALNGTTVDNSSNTKVGAAYLRGFLSLPASDALTVTWWGKIAAYGRGGIFQTTSVSDPSECTDYNTTTIANWDSTFRIYNGDNSFNIFNWFKKDNTWHHHAIVFNGSSIIYYCDGEALVTAAFTGPLVAFNGFCMGLGKAGGVYRQIKQTISDLRIYVTGLSQEAILELYHTSATIDNNGNIYARELVE